MNKSKQLEIIIYESLDEINVLLPTKKKIKKGNFSIKKNSLFDSLNYITFLLNLEKKIKSRFRKNVNLYDLDIIFENKNELFKYIFNKI